MNEVLGKELRIHPLEKRIYVDIERKNGEFGKNRRQSEWDDSRNLRPELEGNNIEVVDISKGQFIICKLFINNYLHFIRSCKSDLSILLF